MIQQTMPGAAILKIKAIMENILLIEKCSKVKIVLEDYKAGYQ
jgi:hypothetical protein